jgi:hypothetical protein
VDGPPCPTSRLGRLDATPILDPADGNKSICLTDRLLASAEAVERLQSMTKANNPIITINHFIVHPLWQT